MKQNKIKNNIFSLLLVSAFCMGCGNKNSSSSSNELVNNTNTEITEHVTLKFWHGFTGADGDSMEAMVNKFNQEHQGKITIEMEVYTWDTLFTKLFTTTTNARFMPHVVALGAN